MQFNMNLIAFSNKIKSTLVRDINVRIRDDWANIMYGHFSGIVEVEVPTLVAASLEEALAG